MSSRSSSVGAHTAPRMWPLVNASRARVSRSTMSSAAVPFAQSAISTSWRSARSLSAKKSRLASMSSRVNAIAHLLSPWHVRPARGLVQSAPLLRLGDLVVVARVRQLRLLVGEPLLPPDLVAVPGDADLLRGAGGDLVAVAGPVETLDRRDRHGVLVPRHGDRRARARERELVAVADDRRFGIFRAVLGDGLLVVDVRLR